MAVQGDTGWICIMGMANVRALSASPALLGIWLPGPTKVVVQVSALRKALQESSAKNLSANVAWVQWYCAFVSEATASTCLIMIDFSSPSLLEQHLPLLLPDNKL